MIVRGWGGESISFWWVSISFWWVKYKFLVGLLGFYKSLSISLYLFGYIFICLEEKIIIKG